MPDPITYRDSGVDIDAGNEAVQRIKKILASSPKKVPGGMVIGGIGGFAGLFKPFLENYTEPLLVGSTDSVGTKILLALEHKKLNGIGQDVVAMCVNDLIASGSRPLFFLDYLGLNKADPDDIAALVKSVNDACIASDCILIGGECAEMPDMYAPGHTDLAGFAVGIVDRDKVIDGSKVKPGDAVIGLQSSGIHSNGFTLVRKLIDRAEWKLSEPMPGDEKPLIDVILEPTRLYVRAIMNLIELLEVKALAHITGGGLIDNVPRAFPDQLAWKVAPDSWPIPKIFSLIQSSAKISGEEMWRTFNCGIGFVAVVDKAHLERALVSLKKSGEKPMYIGEIIEKRSSYGDDIVIDSDGLHAP